MSGAVSQWLVRATDDRVVVGSNPSDSVVTSKLGVGQVRLPHIAYSRSTGVCRHNNLLVPSISMVSMAVEVKTSLYNKYRFS